VLGRFCNGAAARLGRGVRHAGLAAGVCSACASEPDPHQIGRRGADIIGGELADAAELNHTGGLVRVDPETLEPALFCTATLIGPETVVTAKHCARRLAEYAARGFDLAWLAGPSVAAPVEIIPIVAAVEAPANQGGFVGLGQDVAVVHLEHPTSIPPAVPTLLTSAEIGQSMLSIGYGMFTVDGDQDGRRRVGHETVIATEGRTFEAMFGSFENFVEWALTGQTTSENILLAFSPGDLLGALILASYRRDFDSLLLLEGHEAVTGRAPGDSQSCSGDSGGPLARLTPDGTWQTFGVVSGGLYSARSVCDYGTVFSTFGPESLAFVMAELEGREPPPPSDAGAAAPSDAATASDAAAPSDPAAANEEGP